MRRVEQREFAELFVPRVNLVLRVFDRWYLLAVSVFVSDVGEHFTRYAVRGP